MSVKDYNDAEDLRPKIHSNRKHHEN